MLTKGNSSALLNDINNTSTNTKKYYWMKLPIDFFQSRDIKKLRKIAGGDTYVVILLKLMLQTVKTNGVLEVSINPEEDIAIDLDEDINNVKICLSYLRAQSMIEEFGSSILVSSVPPLIGSESSSAERMRKLRDKNKVSQSDALVTANDQCVTQNKTEKIRENKKLQQKDQQEKKEFLSFTYLDEYLAYKLKNAINPTALEHTVRKKLLDGVQTYVDEYNLFVSNNPVDETLMTDIEYLRCKLIGQTFLSSKNDCSKQHENCIISIDGTTYDDCCINVENELNQNATVKLASVFSSLSLLTKYALNDRFKSLCDVF